jgi:hypothetical protein
MKKRYNTPVVEYVELKSNPVMTTMSLPTDGGGESEGRGDSDDQGVGGYRGDWEDIWKNM